MDSKHIPDKKYLYNIVKPMHCNFSLNKLTAICKLIENQYKFKDNVLR